MWIFADEKIIFDKITAFSTSDNFEVSLQRRVASLCNQLLPGFQAINLKLCTDVISIMEMCI